MLVKKEHVLDKGQPDGDAGDGGPACKCSASVEGCEVPSYRRAYSEGYTQDRRPQKNGSATPEVDEWKPGQTPDGTR